MGVLYNLFIGKPGGYQDCCVHIAARPGAHWATEEFLYHACAYPFLELGCRRVTGLVSRKNKRARKIFEKIGWEFEACLKEQRPDDDTIVYRMFNDKCKWLDYKEAADG